MPDQHHCAQDEQQNTQAETRPRKADAIDVIVGMDISGAGPPRLAAASSAVDHRPVKALFCVVFYINH